MAKSIITDFSAGLASPRMEGRIDLELYQKACRELQNMILDTRGGVDRRPGLKYVLAATSASAKSRLIEFEFSSTKSFFLELSNAKCRVLNPDGTVHTASLGSPTWTTAQLFEISYGQSESTMYLTHTGLSGGVHKIVYTSGSDSFALTAGVTFTGTAFTGAGDVPGALTFHERRLVMGFTLNDPMALWGSKSPTSAGATQYENFTVAAAADDAFKYVIAADKGDQGKWLLSSRDLLIGTRGSEYVATGYDAGLTPTNFFVKRQSNNGSKALQAFMVDDAVVYVRRDGKKVMEQVFSRERGGYASRDLTFLAENIAGDGIVDAALQTAPDNILWYVTSDGALVGVTYNREFGVQGWHRHVTDGTFESVCVLDADGEDIIWVSVSRTINGSTVRNLEKFMPRDWGTDRDDAFFVDSGYTWDAATEVGADGSISIITQSALCTITIDTSYANDSLIKITSSDMTEVNGNVYMLKSRSGSGPYLYDLYTEDGTLQIDASAFASAGTSGTASPVLKTITGLTWLEGESVIALRDGAVEEPVATVSGGSITLSTHAQKVHIGLKYTSILSPMKLNIAPGDVSRAHRLVVRFYKSQTAQWGPTSTDVEDVFPASTVIGQPPALKTGDITKEFDGSWTREPVIAIVNDSANPTSVLFIVAEVKVSGGR
jgi:hypothetical protein